MKVSCESCGADVEVIYYDVEYDHKVGCEYCGNEYRAVTTYGGQILAKLLEDYDERNEND